MPFEISDAGVQWCAVSERSHYASTTYNPSVRSGLALSSSL